MSSSGALIRVLCEADDCGALLEVNLDAAVWNQPVIVVRCGSCQRLLEVRLDPSAQVHAPPQHLPDARHPAGLPAAQDSGASWTQHPFHQQPPRPPHTHSNSPWPVPEDTWRNPPPLRPVAPRPPTADSQLQPGLASLTWANAGADTPAATSATTSHHPSHPSQQGAGAAAQQQPHVWSSSTTSTRGSAVRLAQHYTQDGYPDTGHVPSPPSRHGPQQGYAPAPHAAAGSWQHTDNLDWTSRHSNTSWPTPHPPQPQPSPTSTLPAHSSSLLTRAAHNTHPPPHTHEGATGSETAMPSQGVGAVGVSVCEGDDWDSAAPFLSLLLSDEMDIDVLGTLTQLLAGELGGADSQPAESATQTPRDKGDKGKGGEGATGTAQRKTRKRKAPGGVNSRSTIMLSPYSAFMREEMRRLRAQDPTLDHRAALRMAASNWASSRQHLVLNLSQPTPPTNPQHPPSDKQHTDKGDTQVTAATTEPNKMPRTEPPAPRPTPANAPTHKPLHIKSQGTDTLAPPSHPPAPHTDSACASPPVCDDSENTLSACVSDDTSDGEDTHTQRKHARKHTTTVGPGFTAAALVPLVRVPTDTTTQQRPPPVVGTVPTWRATGRGSVVVAGAAAVQPLCAPVTPRSSALRACSAIVSVHDLTSRVQCVLAALGGAVPSRQPQRGSAHSVCVSPGLVQVARRLSLLLSDGEEEEECLMQLLMSLPQRRATLATAHTSQTPHTAQQPLTPPAAAGVAGAIERRLTRCGLALEPACAPLSPPAGALVDLHPASPLFRDGSLDGALPDWMVVRSVSQYDTGLGGLPWLLTSSAVCELPPSLSAPSTSSTDTALQMVSSFTQQAQPQPAKAT